MNEDRVSADLVVAAFIRTPQGKILFVPREGKWTLPTGHLQLSDQGDMRGALLREMREELGVSIFVGDSLGKFFRKENHNGRSKYIEVFMCSISTSEAKKVNFHEAGESGQVWLTVREAGQRNDLDELARNGVEFFLEKISQIRERTDYGSGRGSSSSSNHQHCQQRQCCVFSI